LVQGQKQLVEGKIRHFIGGMKSICGTRLIMAAIQSIQEVCCEKFAVKTTIGM